MKNGKNPTLKQIKIMRLNGMNPSDWLVSKVYADRIECVHRHMPGRMKTAYYEPAVVGHAR